MANSTRRRSISVSIGEVNEDEAIEKMPPRATKWTTMRNMRIEGHIDRSRAPLQDQRNVVSRRAMQKTEKLRRSASEAPGNRRSTGVSMATHIYSRFKGVLSNLVRHRVEEPIGGDVEPRANLPVSNEAITPLSSRDRLSNQRHSRAKLLAVLSVFAPSLTSVKPSLVAAAIGRLLVFSENRAWTPEMQEKLQHSTKEVYPVLEDLVIHIGLCKESTWAGKDLIKYWRKNGADIEEFTDCLLSDLTRLYEEEAEEF
ncbi:unnamed protein product, partial [Mesorhabditis belari]|uniref:Uncharacterized protein n=1 Tax=Mesorhabditis belari TaxID=2138241 RepID=A0AAF3EDK1_9BILA